MIHLAKERGGAGGGSRTLTGLLSPADFLTDYGFRRPESRFRQPVCGLDYPFTLSRMNRGLGAARLVSTPSRLDSAGIGSGLPLLGGFPDFEQFCIAGFPASTQVFFSSPLRLPFRHARMRIC